MKSQNSFFDQNTVTSKLIAEIHKFGVLVLTMVANRKPKDVFERGEKDFISVEEENAIIYMKIHIVNL